MIENTVLPGSLIFGSGIPVHKSREVSLSMACYNHKLKLGHALDAKV